MIENSSNQYYLDRRDIFDAGATFEAIDDSDFTIHVMILMIILEYIIGIALQKDGLKKNLLIILLNMMLVTTYLMVIVIIILAEYMEPRTTTTGMDDGLLMMHLIHLGIFIGLLINLTKNTSKW